MGFISHSLAAGIFPARQVQSVEYHQCDEPAWCPGNGKTSKIPAESITKVLENRQAPGRTAVMYCWPCQQVGRFPRRFRERSMHCNTGHIAGVSR